MGTAVAKRTAPPSSSSRLRTWCARSRPTSMTPTTPKPAASTPAPSGQLLLQLREQIESGEAGNGINWWEWCEQHISGAARTARLY